VSIHRPLSTTNGSMTAGPAGPAGRWAAAAIAGLTSEGSRHFWDGRRPKRLIQKEKASDINRALTPAGWMQRRAGPLGGWSVAAPTWPPSWSVVGCVVAEESVADWRVQSEQARRGAHGLVAPWLGLGLWRVWLQARAETPERATKQQSKQRSRPAANSKQQAARPAAVRPRSLVCRQRGTGRRANGG
jgi:hypothetical protein